MIILQFFVLYLDGGNQHIKPGQKIAPARLNLIINLRQAA